MDDIDEYIKNKELLDMIDKYFPEFWNDYKQSGIEYSTDELMMFLGGMSYQDKGIELFNICGCGIPDDVTKLYHEALREINSGSTRFTDNKLLQAVVLYNLSDWGMTEHGSSIYNSWLNEKGKTALNILDYGDEKTGEAE